LDKEIADYFADILALAQSLFEDVEHKTDMTPKRAILRLNAKYKLYQIMISELFSDDRRKYRYYVLHGNLVEAGFDNSPDPRAIRLKYGKIGRAHTGEHIPHLHLEDKTHMILTEEMTFKKFIAWLKVNYNNHS